MKLVKAGMARTIGCTALGLVLMVGCGGSKPPPAKTGVPEAKETPREPLEEPIDLSPVKAPSDLVLLGRFARPLTVVDGVARWAGLPMSVRQLLPPDVSWVAPIVAWDAPIQAAGVIDAKKGMPELVWVVSVGLTSVDAAVAALRDHGHALHRVAPGIFQVAGEDPSCAIAAARGQAPARLVCSENLRNVEQLLPYATRGLPDVPGGKSDLEVEFVAEPLQRMFAQQLSSLTFLSGFVIRELSIDHAGFDRALADAVYGLAGELQVLAVEIDRVRVDGKFDETGNVLDLGFALKLRADKSWTGQLLSEAAQRSSPAPDTFWQLPESATGASYANSVSPERLKVIARTLADLADGYLDKEKVGRAARDRVKASITDLLSLSGTVAQAQGQAGPMPKDPTLEQRVAQAIGWEIMVADAPAEPFLRAYRDLHQVLGDRDLRKLAARLLDVDVKVLPTSTEKAFTGKGVPPGGRVFTIAAPPALIEKFADNALDGAAKDKKTSIKLVWAIVPDGKRTLMALAPDEKTAAERIAAFKSGKEPTLAARQELGSLRTAKAFASGFTSLSALSSELASMSKRDGLDSQRLLDGLPHHGRSPILTNVIVERGDGPTLRLQFTVPRAAIEDVAGLAPSLAPKF